MIDLNMIWWFANNYFEVISHQCINVHCTYTILLSCALDITIFSRGSVWSTKYIVMSEEKKMYKYIRIHKGSSPCRFIPKNFWLFIPSISFKEVGISFGQCTQLPSMVHYQKEIKSFLVSFYKFRSPRVNDLWLHHTSCRTKWDITVTL